jgi:hypothetical protein
VQPLHLGGRLGTDLGDQPVAQFPVDPQGVAGTAGAGVHRHQLAVQALAQRQPHRQQQHLLGQAGE